MGYHYDCSLPVYEYDLVAGVYIADRFRHGELEVLTSSLITKVPVGDPETRTFRYRFKQGTVVKFKATPDEYYRVAHWTGTDHDQLYTFQNSVTMTQNRNVRVEFEIAEPRNLYVPESYNTIEDAITASHTGDRIILAPRPSNPYTIENPDGLLFGIDRDGQPKDLVITSTDPNDPTVVASTIINCQGSRYSSKRAFHFIGQTSNTRIEGITIRNAFTARIGLSNALPTGMWPWWTGAAYWYGGEAVEPWRVDPANPNPLPPMRAYSGADATGDSYGGAVLCDNDSKPTLYKCVFENCTVAGGIGGDGADGNYPANMQTNNDLDSQSGGHSGKGTGNGYGGAIAIMDGSSPTILECKFVNNRATGGWGGIPGNAGRSYNRGRYGWGGNDPAGLEFAMLYYGINWQAGYGEGDGHGGAIYVEAGCDPVIEDCQFVGNYARSGYASAGGREGPGNEYPQPFDGDTFGGLGLRWGDNGARNGRGGAVISVGTSAGGSVYIQHGGILRLDGCSFENNQAYRVTSYLEDQTSTRGGAIYMAPNTILNVLPLGTDKTLFSGNAGGALYCSTNSKLVVTGADFVNNLSTVLPGETFGYFDVAGAITVERDANCPPAITDCRFMSNASHVGGGAVRTDSDIDFVNCLLNGNTSLGNGGAFYSYVEMPVPLTHTTKVTFDNCELSGNVAQGFGGAGFVKNCRLSLDDSFLVQNQAFSGGGLLVSYGRLDMNGCMVYGNLVTGLITGSHRKVTAEGFGGGLHLTDSEFVIEHTRFEQNTAKGIIGSGGALCITGSQVYYDQRVRNCLFAGNNSDALGGAVSSVQHIDPNTLNPLPVYFKNCTFANNESKDGHGGAIYLDHTSRLVIERSILSGNKGTAIYEKSGGQSEAYYSLFWANEGNDLSRNGVIYSASSSLTGYDDIAASADPLFEADGPLGDYYLNQASSPAVNPFKDEAGYPTAHAAGLDTFTTAKSGALDGSDTHVDLGYHYNKPRDEDRYTLTVAFKEGDTVRSGVGQIDITPYEYELKYVRGANVKLVANINGEFFLVGWSGGTLNDSSQEHENTVLMTRSKDIAVLVRMRSTLYVGGSSEYDTLGDAVGAANDGDIILVAPGEYTAASQYGPGGSVANSITLTGKKLTISGYAPSDDAVVRATLFRDYRFVFTDLDDETVIEGITIDESRMQLVNSSPIIRNCVFSNCQFGEGTLVHAGNVPAGTDGYHTPPIFGGAMMMFNSSPLLENCAFENNSMEGGDGENGFAGAQSHHTGGDGGWPGGAYGGAVYCGLSSKPTFKHCTFTGNEVFGGDGGDGADGWTDRGIVYNGGRGGGWVFDPETELILR
ncbi:MAG: hypothetical protein LLF76_07680, partial [Planctomycetaceae bacterium]|nr:hypothetical protein [Planctomycetaceae bacterium]